MKRLIQSKYKLYSNILNKIKTPYKEIVSKLLELENETEKIYDYQKHNIISNINFNLLKKYIPDAFGKSTCYRSIILKKDKLDKNNLKESIKNNIHFNNRIESWTIDVNIAYSWKSHLIHKDNIQIILETVAEGLYLPMFWKYLEKEYPEIKLEDIDLFNGEKELLIHSPKNYEIYNLGEIYEKINK